MSETAMTATDTERKTIAQFVDENKIEITAIERAPENPNMQDRGREMFNYFVSLTHDKRTMKLYYSLGAAHVEKWKRKIPGAYYDFKRQAYMVPSPARYGSYYADDAQYAWKPVNPTAADILDCLATDASTVENARDFEYWCNDLGYDSDSRKAEQSYNATVKQAKELRAILGDALYQELLWEVERL